ncbi:MAG: ABC transporter permease [Ruminococcus sp.]|nr:ABC transporter permease [Ruminococcus sp.]MCM1382675.1 ABC transporter permease [Muribaculaceae bacterium]MCM1480987.1 ABC transporter permease [Muribaculaceae bacterium]
MNKLLRANFMRLAKNKVFWGCMIFMFTDALNTLISMYTEHKRYGIVWDENAAFGQTVAVALISAIFVGLFIGTEHSNGTMRNKFVVGHTRAAVYSANFAVCVFASLMLHIAYFLTVLLGGIIMFDNFVVSPEKLLFNFAVSLIVAAAYAAVVLPVSMLVASKSSGVTAVILTALVLMIAAMVIGSGLNEPEFHSDEMLTVTDLSGNVEVTEPQKENPYYISGVKREIYEALYDIIPTCQGLRIQNGDMPENNAVFPLWSAGIAAAATAAGAVLFRRKDLK